MHIHSLQYIPLSPFPYLPPTFLLDNLEQSFINKFYLIFSQLDSDDIRFLVDQLADQGAFGAGRLERAGWA